MPHQIDYLSKDRLIVVRRHGETDIKDMRNSLKRVMEISAEKGAISALIDTRKVSSFPTVDDIYNFATNLPAGIRFALVLPSPNEHQRHNVKELEKIFKVQESITTLGNISKSSDKSVRVFDKYEEAILWLNKNTQP